LQRCSSFLAARPRCVYERSEDGPRRFIFFYGAFGVPLDCQNKMIGRSSFEGFDDAVGGAAGGDTEILADGAGGLVVGGVYGEE
jgi:hypothetical protein